MTTHILIPGLLSDGRIWRELGAVVKRLGPIVEANVMLDDSIEQMATRLLGETGGPLIAIGHSMGGRVAMEMAHQAPDRMRGLVLSNTGHGPANDREHPMRQARIDLGYENMEQLAAEWVPPMLATDSPPDPALLSDLSQMARAVGPVVHERQIRALLGRPNASAYLPQIGCPILLITGERDNWSPPAQHREIEDQTRDSILHVIRGAGHFLPCEKPQETVNIVMNWLTARKEELYV